MGLWLGEIGSVAGRDGERRVDTGNRRECDLVARHQGLVRQLGMGAWRRLNVVADPAIERNKERALRKSVLVSIGLLRARTLRRQITAGNVLCPGKQVDADIVRGLGIFAAVERRVGKGRRAPAAPVFTR